MEKFFWLYTVLSFTALACLWVAYTRANQTIKYLKGVAANLSAPTFQAAVKNFEEECHLRDKFEYVFLPNWRKKLAVGDEVMLHGTTPGVISGEHPVHGFSFTDNEGKPFTRFYQSYNFYPVYNWQDPVVREWQAPVVNVPEGYLEPADKLPPMV